MAALLVTTPGPRGVGLTALCASIGARLRAEGFQVGYLKPYSPSPRLREGQAPLDEDAEFVAQALQLRERNATLAPLAFGPTGLRNALAAGPDAARQKVRDAFSQAQAGRDVVLIDGPAGLDGTALGIAAPDLADQVDARVLAVVRYLGETSADALAATARFGSRLLGVVLNDVPAERTEIAREALQPVAERAGVRLLGMIPVDTSLLGVTVADVARHLHAEIIGDGESHADDPVEHMMIGAMTVDSMLGYFQQKPHKVVITAVDRPDVQLAALETSTSCLVLTGEEPPSPLVIARAEDFSVPIIHVRDNILDVIESMENLFGQQPFRHPRKVERLGQLLGEYLDWDALKVGLGLPVGEEAEA